MHISWVRWPSTPAALWVLAWMPSAAGSSSWLSCKSTKSAPSFVSSAPINRYVKQQQAWASSSRSSSKLASTSRLALTCSLDDLRAAQREAGGVVGDVSYDEGQHVCKNVLLSGFEAGVSTRERADAVDEAVSTATLLADKSHWGVIRVKGEDRLRFLHSQGTNSFERADTGAVVSTCFTNNVGRVVDFCEGVVLEDEVWLVSSPHRWQSVLQTMDKFIFPMDKTTVSSMSDEMALFSLTGPGAVESLAELQSVACPPAGRSVEWNFEGAKVTTIRHARAMTRRPKSDDTGGGGDLGAAPEGGGGEVPALGSAGDAYYYTLLAPMSVSAKLWSALSSPSSVVIAGEEDWQTLRIKQGFPFPGKELTKDYNPLEAGLWHSVHFDKGCYIGQESISRVNAYNAVKAGLYGIAFDEPGVPEGAELVVEETGKRAGVVTSVMDPDAGDSPFGLAYIKTLAGGVGLKVVTKEGSRRGTVVQVPYPTRSDAESAMPPVKKEDPGEEAAAASLGLEEKAKEKARKAAKLEAMQKKLDALKARRKTAS